MSLPYKGNLIKFAKQLRQNSTRHENRLWYDFLRKYPIRFQRQKTIGNFIVDFYCHSCKLVIELDGSQHFEKDGLSYDEKRTSLLEKHGVEILRFSNSDIDNNFYGVCTMIDMKVNERMK